MALAALAIAAATVVFTLLSARSGVPQVTRVLLATPSLLVAVAVLRSSRRDDPRTLVLATRALVATMLMTVLVASSVEYTSDGDLTTVGFLGVALLLSALVLDGRDHVVATTLSAVVGVGVVLLAGGGVETVRALIPGLTVGVIAGVGMRELRDTLDELDEQRRAAMSSSGAFRAVVDAASAATVGDAQQVLEAVTTATSRLGSETAGLYLLGADGLLRYGATHNVPDHLVDESFTIDHGIAGACLRRGSTVVTNDYQAYTDAMPEYTETSLRAAVAVPIVIDDEPIGALVAGMYGDGRYDDTAVTAFELLAGHAGRAVALARAIGEDRATLGQLQRLHTLQEDFVSTVSHELRTPLTVIEGLAETLLVRGDGLDAAMRGELLARVAANARSLSSVVTSILELGRLDRGLAEFAPDVVDLAALLEDCVSRLRPLLEDHELRLDLDSATTTARGDEALLDRVVDNLLVNAARHTPPGTRIDVSVRAGEEHVAVTVADAGPGIPAHELAHVTERFRRLGASTTREARGLGIGLALVDQVLRLHGTTLELSSTVGEGTSFSFRLPRSTTTAAAGACGDDRSRSAPAHARKVR